MKTMKRITIKLILGIAAFGSAMTAHNASALTIDPEITAMINSMIVQMQQRTMQELYAQAPLKNQMRGKMMQEFASKAILMNKIQPVLMEANMNATKGVLMARMVERPIPLP
jgi:vancomycin resistance protein YoaR